jgi:hypothetical protein
MICPASSIEFGPYFPVSGTLLETTPSPETIWDRVVGELEPSPAASSLGMSTLVSRQTADKAPRPPM